MNPPGDGASDGAHPYRADAGANSGRRHWRWQRASAIALVPLTLWFVTQILNHIGDGYHAALAWVAQPAAAAALIAYLAFAFAHSQLGLQVIFEDYIATESMRAKAVLACAAVNALGFVAATVAVLRIAL
ncbi:MAG: succinate dehydrogenase, hydrophobic membrane anchor protein [bacterium]